MSEKQKIVYTDRYAVQVWLPLVIGIGMLAGGFLSEQPSNSRVILGAILLAWAGYAYWRRSKTNTGSQQ